MLELVLLIKTMLILYEKSLQKTELKRICFTLSESDLSSHNMLFDIISIKYLAISGNCFVKPILIKFKWGDSSFVLISVHCLYFLQKFCFLWYGSSKLAWLDTNQIQSFRNFPKFKLVFSLHNLILIKHTYEIEAEHYLQEIIMYPQPSPPKL